MTFFFIFFHFSARVSAIVFTLSVVVDELSCKTEKDLLALLPESRDYFHFHATELFFAWLYIRLLTLAIEARAAEIEQMELAAVLTFVDVNQLMRKLSLQSVDLKESYITLVDIGVIWRMATPSAEDQQKHDGNPCKWSDYIQKVSSSIINDPYDKAYSTKDDERDLRIEGNVHFPNIYMKLDDPFPSDRAFKTMLCSVSNKGRLQ